MKILDKIKENPIFYANIIVWSVVALFALSGCTEKCTKQEKISYSKEEKVAYTLPDYSTNIIKDRDTGCEFYRNYYYLVPRTDANGKHICKK